MVYIGYNNSYIGVAKKLIRSLTDLCRISCEVLYSLKVHDITERRIKEFAFIHSNGARFHVIRTQGEFLDCMELCGRSVISIVEKHEAEGAVFQLYRLSTR